MRKLVLLIGTLLLSTTIFAATGTPHQLGTEILKAVQKSNREIANNTVSAFPMIYGGQDISRSLVATADESLWAGQHMLIG